MICQGKTSTQTNGDYGKGTGWAYRRRGESDQRQEVRSHRKFVAPHRQKRRSPRTYDGSHRETDGEHGAVTAVFPGFLS